MARSARSAQAVSITPTPRYAKLDAGAKVEMPTKVTILLGKSVAVEEHRWAVAPLAKALRVTSARMKKVARKTAKLPPHCILVGAPEDHQALAALLVQLKSKLPKSGLGDEGYLLSIGEEGVRLVAGAPGGAFYGVQTLLQLLEDRTLPTGVVADVPAEPFRGIHLPLGDPANIPLLEKFITKVAPRHKMNTLILQIGYHFKFKSHPEVKEDTMYTPAQARKLARLCRQNHVRLIPMVNCFGHQSWRAHSIHGMLRAYPEFNETPDKPDPICYNWCPSDPRINPIAFALLDEVIDAFEADALHIGMDEVLYLGVCDRCKGKDPGDLFAKVMNEFHAHVVGKRKVRMLIWGDRLIDGRQTPYNRMNGSRNGTHTALARIPKDILVCDWHYHLHRSYPSVEMFEQAGLDYVASGWRKKDAIRAFFKYATAQGGRHFQGYLATNWGSVVPIMRYLAEGKLGGENADVVKNIAECYQLGMELAWAGVKQ